MWAGSFPIKKTNVNTDKALRIFHEHKMYDKKGCSRYRRASRVNLYSIGDFEDYYYGYMVPHTGYLKYFELYLYDEGFVLQFPTMAEPERVPPFAPQHKVFQVLKEATKWGDMLGISTVGDLNDCISRGGMQQLIMTQEALQERRIAEIASRIAADPGKKFIMIAGPLLLREDDLFPPAFHPAFGGGAEASPHRGGQLFRGAGDDAEGRERRVQFRVPGRH